jgi:hypothetical protein
MIAFGIYYPLFFSEYAYTDDWFALWQHQSMKGIHGLIAYGRYITDTLNNWLYDNLHVKTVKDLIFIRLFSFFGWIVCIPIWYFIIKKIVLKENLPASLVFFSTLYLLCTPPFSIYVGWASCFEQFIANTSGLISGYILYSSIKYQDERIVVPSFAIMGSLVFGVMALFTYQNGFGCFLLPFLLHFIAKPKNSRIIIIGVGFYLFISIVYYLLFKYNLRNDHVGESTRTKISIDVFPKIKFFFTQPLATAFRFTYIANEKSVTGVIISAIIFFIWVVITFYQITLLSKAKRLKQIFIILLILALIYLPSLIVKEMYSSNRTLFALNMAVFFLVSNSFLLVLKNHKIQLGTISILSLLFVLNAWYNFSKQFLNPIKKEYTRVRSFIENNYTSSIKTVYVISPDENFFVRKYGITRSWDEFGVPCTFFSWAPEFFTKQVVFEKTDNRSVAEKLLVKQYSDKKQFSDSLISIQNSMTVDLEELMK